MTPQYPPGYRPGKAVPRSKNRKTGPGVPNIFFHQLFIERQLIAVPTRMKHGLPCSAVFVVFSHAREQAVIAMPGRQARRRSNAERHRVPGDAAAHFEKSTPLTVLNGGNAENLLVLRKGNNTVRQAFQLLPAAAVQKGRQPSPQIRVNSPSYG